MTRPMPGPPDCSPDGSPHESVPYNGGDFLRCHRHDPTRRYRKSKRLTDEGCAAHYWQAEADEMVHLYTWHDSEFRDEEADDAYAHIRATWRRFKDAPHALEIGEAAS